MEGKRILNSCVVEIPGSDHVGMVHLLKHYFPILPDVTDLKFKHAGSHRRCTIKRKQVPIEPGFAITAHKAQGQTMGKVVVDIEGCSGTEQPYVMVSRCTSIDGLVILRDFNFGKITNRHSEDLRNEFARLEYLWLQTIVKYGSEEEILSAKCGIRSVQHGGSSMKRKGGMGVGDGERTKKRKIDGK